jgi:hypothetical protein
MRRSARQDFDELITIFVEDRQIRERAVCAGGEPALAGLRRCELRDG